MLDRLPALNRVGFRRKCGLAGEVNGLEPYPDCNGLMGECSDTDRRRV